jgi:hypothetical protein
MQSEVARLRLILPNLHRPKVQVDGCTGGLPGEVLPKHRFGWENSNLLVHNVAAK